MKLPSRGRTTGAMLKKQSTSAAGRRGLKGPSSKPKIVSAARGDTRTADLVRTNLALQAEMEERRRAEARALSERQRLYDVLETLPAYVILLSRDYHVPFANRFFRERFGDSHGRCCFEYLFDRTTPCENCETYKVLQTGAEHRWKWTGPDGRRYDIHDFPFSDADGTPFILEMGIDITERVNAEAELDRYRKQLEEMVDVRTAALAASEETIRNQNTILGGMNRIFEAALTTATEAELGRICLEVAEEVTDSTFGFVAEITPDGLQNIAISDPGRDACTVSLASGLDTPLVFKIHGIYGHVLTEGKSLIANDPASHPARIGLPEGHPPLECFLGVPLIRDGRTIGMVAVANRPGGYTRREQEALETIAPAIVETFGRKRTEQALRDSEAQHRAVADLLDKAGQPFGVGYPDGALGYVNPAFERLTGYGREELRTMSWNETLTPPEWRSVESEKLEELNRTGEPVLYEKEYIRKDGSRVPIELLVHVVRDPNGRPLHYYSFITDLTPRKQAEAVLRDLNEVLEERVRDRTAEVRAQTTRLRALAAQLSQVEQRERRRLARILHDHVQQLLSAARMQILWLRREPASEQVVNDALALDATLKEALDATRSLTVELSPPILQEGGLVAGLRWLGARMAEKNGFQVEVKSQSRVEPESEDIRTVLFECTRELLQNALKHSGVSQVEVTVSRMPDDRITIVVQDRGKGFDLAELRARQLASEAFGLFSVQERLAHVSGTMAIESAPDAGTRVTLMAPLGSEAATTSDEGRGGAAPTPSRPRPARAPGQKIRLLIVDDHQVVREGLGTMLRTERDLEVVGEAATADEAIELAKALDPDVVIMDVSLGTSSGIDATAMIRRNQPHINIVALSMHDDPFLIDAMRNAGAAAYLSKTGAAEDLIKAIRACAQPA